VGSAYVRRCFVEGVFAVVRRRGAEETGVIFIKVNRLGATADICWQAVVFTGLR
jgi:hypothetical protein